jgi:hypothetical protein
MIRLIEGKSKKARDGSNGKHAIPDTVFRLLSSGRSSIGVLYLSYPKAMQ